MSLTGKLFPWSLHIYNIGSCIKDTWLKSQWNLEVSALNIVFRSQWRQMCAFGHLPLKPERYHEVNFVFTDSKIGCHNDNLLYHEWRPNRHHNNSWFSVSEIGEIFIFIVLVLMLYWTKANGSWIRGGTEFYKRFNLSQFLLFYQPVYTWYFHRCFKHSMPRAVGKICQMPWKDGQGWCHGYPQKPRLNKVRLLISERQYSAVIFLQNVHSRPTIANP